MHPIFRHSIIVVLPHPLSPTMIVNGFRNLIVFGSNGLNARMPWMDILRISAMPKKSLEGKIKPMEMLKGCYNSFKSLMIAKTKKMSPEELIALASTDYKQAKELFSINVTGCSFSDIMLTLLLLPLLCIIYQEICKFVFKIPVSFFLVKFIHSCILCVPNGFLACITFALSFYYL